MKEPVMATRKEKGYHRKNIFSGGFSGMGGMTKVSGDSREPTLEFPLFCSWEEGEGYQC